MPCAKPILDGVLTGPNQVAQCFVLRKPDFSPDREAEGRGLLSVNKARGDKEMG